MHARAAEKRSTATTDVEAGILLIDLTIVA
jgi:hypothetical protein